MKAAMRILAALCACAFGLAPAALTEEAAVMRMQVSDGEHTVMFELNDTPAAGSLYDQLPLELDVGDYGGNEKTFYPPLALDGANAREGGGDAGGLAYFSPWGDVAMYYGAFGSYPGLWLLGEAVEGAEAIDALSGTIRVTPGPSEYRSIAQDAAAEILAGEGDFILLDVRTEDEYAQGHIPGAICVPNETIGEEPPEQLPELRQTILVYCRSGRRSKEASAKLAAMGYVNVIEFGGINTWTGEVE